MAGRESLRVNEIYPALSMAGWRAVFTMLDTPETAPHDCGRNAMRDAVGFDVLGNDRAGPDHCAISDSDSIKNLAAGADPNVLADIDSFLRQRLRVHRQIESREAVIRRDDN